MAPNTVSKGIVALTLTTFMALALSVFVSFPVDAQVVGATLSGTVTDASGAAIPNAQILINDTATGAIREVTTDAVGFYAVPNLLPGTYSVTTSANGFATVVESNLLLTVGGQRTLNESLPVGKNVQRVEVSAAAETVQLASSTISAEVNDMTVRELPLNGRDWTALADLQPGVIPILTQAVTTSPTASRLVRGFGNQISVAGHRPYENSYRINGVDVNDYANSGPGNVLGGALGVDAIQEFSVLEGNYSTEYGRTTGGIINAITKSGTNGFHGSAYWFLRDKALDTRNYFDPAVIPPFHRNNFGASFGGPIKKDKTFFFFDYEGFRQDKSISELDFVPSPAARAGNLCSIPTGVTPACTPTSITVNPLVTPFFALYPLPNAGLIGNGDVGDYRTSGLDAFSENYYIARIDHKFSENDSLATSFLYDPGLLTQPDPMNNASYGTISGRHMFSMEETHIFSPRLVNAVRVGYSRAVGENGVDPKALTAAATDASLGSLPGRDAADLSIPSLTQLVGGFDAGSLNILVYNSFQANDDAFLTLGSHSLRFGFAWEHMQNYNDTVSMRNAIFTFPSLQGFLLDEPSTAQFPGSGAVGWAYFRQSLFGAYLQDDWRARSNLTLNLGVRYEPATLPTEAHNNYQSIVSLTPGPFGNEPCCTASVPLHTLWQTNQTLTNFEPRVGFSWDPFRNGKTAVRGGFGIFADLPLTWLYSGGSAVVAYPFSVAVTENHLAPGSFPTGAITSVTAGPSVAVNRYIEQNPQHSYDMSWNLNIQREIAPSLTAMVGYVGSRSVHQPDTYQNMDMVLPTLTSAGYLWPFPVGSGTEFNPNVGAIRGITWHGTASYSGLEAQVAKKMSYGFQAQASYTWSKCLDDGSVANVQGAFTNDPTNWSLWFDKGSRYGLCDFNVTQHLVMNSIWDLPKPKFGGAIASYLLGGWEASGIFTASTGQPFTVLIAGDPEGTKGNPDPYPDRVAGCNPYNANFKSQRLAYLNLGCFTPPVVPASFPNYATSCQPAAASEAAVIPSTCMNLQGNAGRNRLIGPGLADLDFSLIKNTYIPRISETFNVQFRTEVFNIFNHTIFQLPTDQFNLFNANGTPISTGGALDSTAIDSREIQFGLKIIW